MIENVDLLADNSVGQEGILLLKDSDKTLVVGQVAKKPLQNENKQKSWELTGAYFRLPHSTKIKIISTDTPGTRNSKVYNGVCIEHKDSLWFIEEDLIGQIRGLRLEN
ncbi:hypothetical protein JW766_01660 [Candidatus Dojkabacteria bacterium]|nr:hypothetical protein [Candidatus Dojkabacteria bacterium]